MYCCNAHETLVSAQDKLEEKTEQITQLRAALRMHAVMLHEEMHRHGISFDNCSLYVCKRPRRLLLG